MHRVHAGPIRRDRDTSLDRPESAASNPCRRSSRSSPRARCFRPPSPDRLACRRRRRFPYGVPLTPNLSRNLMTLIRFGWCLVLVSIAAGCGGSNPDRSTASTPASSPPAVGGEGRAARSARGGDLDGAAAHAVEPRRAGQLARAGRHRLRAEVCRAVGRRVVCGDDRRLDKNWFVSAADVPTVMRMKRRHARRQLVSSRGLQTRGLRHPVWPTPRTKARPGRVRSCRTTTRPGRSTASCRCSRCRQAGSASSGSTAATRASSPKTPRWRSTSPASIRHGNRPLKPPPTRASASAARRPPSSPRTASSRRSAIAARRRSATSTCRVSRTASGRDAQIVHADNWEIDACPVNGPALSARGRQLVAAWFTGKDDKGQAFAAFSDRRRTHLGRIRSSSTIRRRWDTSMSRCSTTAPRSRPGSSSPTTAASSACGASSRRGCAPPSITINGDSRVSGYPRVARSGNELVFAWTEGSEGEGTQKVRGAIAKLP